MCVLASHRQPDDVGSERGRRKDFDVSALVSLPGNGVLPRKLIPASGDSIDKFDSRELGHSSHLAFTCANLLAERLFCKGRFQQGVRDATLLLW
jgi:hypothetical protein